VAQRRRAAVAMRPKRRLVSPVLRLADERGVSASFAAGVSTGA
jgi:hypothetical protein